MNPTDERAELESLVTSPGWLRVLEHARLEWKEGYPAKMKLARMNAKRDGEDAGQAMDRVDAAADAVNAVLSWPQERLQRVAERQAREHAIPSESRRGTGL